MHRAARLKSRHSLAKLGMRNHSDNRHAEPRRKITLLQRVEPHIRRRYDVIIHLNQFPGKISPRRSLHEQRIRSVTALLHNIVPQTTQQAEQICVVAADELLTLLRRDINLPQRTPRFA